MLILTPTFIHPVIYYANRLVAESLHRHRKRQITQFRHVHALTVGPH